MRGMRRSCFNRNFAIITALVIAVILYVCLYPFAFRQPAGNSGPVHRLSASWAEWHGRGDFLSNILLYMPFGFFAVLAIVGNFGFWRRFSVATLAGGLLSLGVELAQYYDAGRTTAAIDLYSNLIGTAFGAGAACLADGSSRTPRLHEISARRIPGLLLAAWLGYRLFPGGSALDLHRSWLTPPPVGLASTAYGLLDASAMWLTVGMLVEAVFDKRRFRLLFPLFAGVAIVAAAAIARTAPRIVDIAGAGIAFAGLLVSRGGRFRAAAAVLLLCAILIDQQLEPFQLRAAAGHFGWIPFRSFMRGSDHDVVSFLRKSFLYGSAIWLLVETGLRFTSSAVLVAGMLFVTGWAQTWLAGGKADITDPMMVILIAAVIGLMNPEDPAAIGGAGGAGSAVAGRVPR